MHRGGANLKLDVDPPLVRFSQRQRLAVFIESNFERAVQRGVPVRFRIADVILRASIDCRENVVNNLLRAIARRVRRLEGARLHLVKRAVSIRLTEHRQLSPASGLRRQNEPHTE